VRTITLDPETGAAKVLAALEHPEPLLQRWGAILVSDSQRSFREQQFGSIRWPERYEGKGTKPFVNLATALDHMNRGSPPKKRHLQRRPALIDEGGTGLRGSITSRVIGSDTIEVGSVSKHASLHQSGGVDDQPVTLTAKKTLVKWLKTATGKPYRKAMGFLFRREVLSTQVYQRPFIGVSERAEGQIRNSLERYVAEAAGDGVQ